MAWTAGEGSLARGRDLGGAAAAKPRRRGAPPPLSIAFFNTRLEAYRDLAVRRRRAPIATIAPTANGRSAPPSAPGTLHPHADFFGIMSLCGAEAAGAALGACPGAGSFIRVAAAVSTQRGRSEQIVSFGQLLFGPHTFVTDKRVEPSFLSST